MSLVEICKVNQILFLLCTAYVSLCCVAALIDQKEKSIATRAARIFSVTTCFYIFEIWIEIQHSFKSKECKQRHFFILLTGRLLIDALM